MKERVRLLGSILDRPCFYHALDAFLLPSLFEGLPMALLEAMFSRVPVLSSRLEGISAIMTNEKEGLLASVGDVEDFSRQLQRLETSPELRPTSCRERTLEGPRTILGVRDRREDRGYLSPRARYCEHQAG